MSEFKEFDFGKKKKKQSIPIKESIDPDFEYTFLIRRIFSFITANGCQEHPKYTLKPPIIYKQGSKKTIWVNFSDICKAVNRQTEHINAFILMEMCTTGSIDSNGRLILKCALNQGNIEQLLRKYISEYVKCHSCNSPETILYRDNRLCFLECNKCKSKYTVPLIIK